MKNMTPVEIADEAIGIFIGELDRLIAERDPVSNRQILLDLVDVIFPAARAAAVQEVRETQPEISVLSTQGVRVITEDLSGEQAPETADIQDDYIIVCAGSCYVAHTQVYPSTGTHILAIKGRKD